MVYFTFEGLCIWKVSYTLVYCIYRGYRVILRSSRVIISAGTEGFLCDLLLGTRTGQRERSQTPSLREARRLKNAKSKGDRHCEWSQCLGHSSRWVITDTKKSEWREYTKYIRIYTNIYCIYIAHSIYRIYCQSNYKFYIIHSKMIINKFKI